MKLSIYWDDFDIKLITLFIHTIFFDILPTVNTVTLVLFPKFFFDFLHTMDRSWILLFRSRQLGHNPPPPVTGFFYWTGSSHLLLAYEHWIDTVVFLIYRQLVTGNKLVVTKVDKLIDLQGITQWEIG